MAGLMAMMGRYAPRDLMGQRALEARQAAATRPIDQAIAQAGARARSSAMTAAQGSGNPMLARRQAAQDSIAATTPLQAQKAAAQSQLAQQEIAAEQQRRQANAQRMDRFLAAGLSAASSGLGGLMNMIPGGQGQTPGGFGGGGQPGTVTGTYNDPRPPQARPGAAPAQPLTSPAVAAQAGGQPGSLTAANAVAGAQPMNPDGSPASPAGAPQMPRAPGDIAQPQATGGGFNFGQVLQGLSPLASMIPGYGTFIGAGMNGLGALTR